jgi:hypothetical protein
VRAAPRRNADPRLCLASAISSSACPLRVRALLRNANQTPTLYVDARAVSFADLERGLGEGGSVDSLPLSSGALNGHGWPGGLRVQHIDGQVSDSERGFKTLTNRLSIQIFKINSNVTGIAKLVDLLGGSKDTAELRGRL